MTTDPKQIPPPGFVAAQERTSTKSVWKIRIDDGFVEYEYEITSPNGNHSIYELYLGLCSILEARADIEEGKFLGYTWLQSSPSPLPQSTNAPDPKGQDRGQGEGEPPLLPNQCSHCGMIVEGMSMATHTCYVCDTDAPPFRRTKTASQPPEQGEGGPTTSKIDENERDRARLLRDSMPAPHQSAVEWVEKAKDKGIEWVPIGRLEDLARRYDEAKAQAKRYDEYHSKLIVENESVRAQLAAEVERLRARVAELEGKE